MDDWWCTIRVGRGPALLGREEGRDHGGAWAILFVHHGTLLDEEDGGVNRG
jgi:hypothetical protein